MYMKDKFYGRWEIKECRGGEKQDGGWQALNFMVDVFTVSSNVEVFVVTFSTMHVSGR